MRVAQAVEKLFFGFEPQSGKEMMGMSCPEGVRHLFSGEAAYPGHPEPGGEYEELVLKEVAESHPEVIGGVVHLHQALQCLPDRSPNLCWIVQG